MRFEQRGWAAIALLAAHYGLADRLRRFRSAYSTCPSLHGRLSLRQTGCGYCRAARHGYECADTVTGFWAGARCKLGNGADFFSE
jgi:hypothetical protein